jgi:hypothetical protein
MKQWTSWVGGYTKEEVQAYCVMNGEWQSFRLTLKGLPTEQKLNMLAAWYDHRIDRLPRATTVQVDNYINALKRGGQLDMELKVVR